MKPNGGSVSGGRRMKKKSTSKPKPTIHPWEENPGDYFTLVGPIPFLFALPENKEADRIIEEFKLNSAGRVFRRVEYFKEVEKVINLWKEEKDPAIKEFIRNRIFEFIDRGKELAFFGREFAKALGVTSE